MKVKDGIALACGKPLTSRLLKPQTNRRIITVDSQAGLVGAGFPADARHLANRAREEAASYRDNFESAIPASVLAERLALYIQAYTLYSSLRPFGVQTILGVEDQLFMIEPSGVYAGYRACASGKGRQIAKTELEKLKLEEMSLQEAVAELARIIYIAHEEDKDKELELEMSWIPANGLHHLVPDEILRDALAKAKSALALSMQYGE